MTYTREEIITKLTAFENGWEKPDAAYSDFWKDVLNMLEQEPCEDVISREYLKKIAQSEGAYGYVSAYDIATAPSVTHKSGKWIDYRDDGFVECPFCEHATTCEDNIDELHYCFYCGAKMVEPQKSEKINCKSTKCENCINHNYCDFEPQESEEQTE